MTMPRKPNKLLKAHKDHMLALVGHTCGPRLMPSASKYGYNTTNSPADRLTQVLRQGSRSSGRKVTLPKISKGASDDQD